MAGHANHGRVRRDARHHYRAGANARVVTDRDGSDDLRPGADHDVVLQSGMPLLATRRSAAQRHPLVEVAVLADLRRLADHHTHAVIDEEARADAGARVDLDAGEKAPEMREKPREQPEPGRVEPVRGAVNQQRVDARVGKQHLEDGTRGGIALLRGAGGVTDGSEPAHPKVLGLGRPIAAGSASRSRAGEGGDAVAPPSNRRGESAGARALRRGPGGALSRCCPSSAPPRGAERERHRLHPSQSTPHPRRASPRPSPRSPRRGRSLRVPRWSSPSR